MEMLICVVHRGEAAKAKGFEPMIPSNPAANPYRAENVGLPPILLTWVQDSNKMSSMRGRRCWRTVIVSAVWLMALGFPSSAASPLAPRQGGSSLFQPARSTGPVSLGAVAPPALFSREAWSRDDGLPSSTVLALAQSDDGYIWMGTEEGLVRFDGSRMRVFNRDNTPGFGNHYVRSLSTGPDGKLWIGSNAGEIYQTTGGRFEMRAGREATSGKSVVRLVAAPDRRIWAALEGGGFQAVDEMIPPGQPAVTADPSAVPLLDARDVVFDSAGDVWMATRSGLVHKRHGSVPIPIEIFAPDSGSPSEGFTAVCADGFGGFWLGTIGGRIYRYRDRHFTELPTLPLPAAGAVNVLFCDSAGRVWLGLNGGGLWLIEAGSRYVSVLPDAIINDVLQSAEGIIWAATSGGGVHAFRPAWIGAIGLDEGLVPEIILPVLEDSRGGLWAGTAGGGLYYREPGSTGRFVRYGLERGFPGAVVFSLAEDDAGGIWTASAGGNLHYLPPAVSGPRRFRAVKVEGDSSIRAFRSVFADRDGSVWVGTNGFGLLRGRFGQVRPVSSPEALSRSRILSFAQSPDGTLWIGTEGDGLFVRNPASEEYAHYDSSSGLSGNTVDALLFDAETGALWIGTSDGGLGRLAGGRLAALGLENGLFDRVVLQILDDGRGYFWLTSNRGLCRIAKRDLNHAADTNGRVTPFIYGSEDGLPSVECNGGVFPPGVRMRDGRLLVPTIKGLAVIDPGLADQAPSPYATLVEEVLADRRPIAGPGPRLAPGVSRLEFRFTRPAFRGASLLRFRYRLEGYDREWQDAGADRSASYTNLPPGKYLFKVEGSDRFRRWDGAAASSAVRLAPRFTQTWLFVGLCVLGAAGMVFAAYRVHLRKILTVDLARQVDARTSDLRQLLEEKAKLVLELQHRVRNNLQIVLSLIEPDEGLAGAGMDPLGVERSPSRRDSKRVLRERVMALGAIQDAAQRSPDGQLVRMAPLMENMTAILRKRRLRPAPISVSGIDAAALWPIDMASPAAFIVHELAANALDHAFPPRVDRASPAIDIRLERRGGEWTLVVADNGIGWDAQTGPQDGGGLRLVRSLVVQLGGIIRRDGPGTRWTIVFPDAASDPVVGVEGGVVEPPGNQRRDPVA